MGFGSSWIPIDHDATGLQFSRMKTGSYITEVVKKS